MAHWQISEAEDRFDEMLEAVENGERQYIEVDGKPQAVLVPIAEWDELMKRIASRDSADPEF